MNLHDIAERILYLHQAPSYWTWMFKKRKEMKIQEDWMREQLVKFGVKDVAELKFNLFPGPDRYHTVDLMVRGKYVMTYKKEIVLNHRASERAKVVFMHELGHALLRETFDFEIGSGELERFDEEILAWQFVLNHLPMGQEDMDFLHHCLGSYIDAGEKVKFSNKNLENWLEAIK